MFDSFETKSELIDPYLISKHVIQTICIMKSYM